jgi:type I restriction enzyme M protein
MNKIDQILKNTNYSLAIFTQEEILVLENNIVEKTDKDKTTYYTTCLVRNKQIQLKPEEIVRQLFLYQLINNYKYPKDRIQVEYPVQFGIDSSKRADIAIFDKDRPTVVYMLVELKKPKAKEGKEQLKSYCNATGAPIGVWTNGQQINHYHRKDPNIFDEIRDIPKANQTLKDILNEKFTIVELYAKDKLKTKSLKRIIEEFEDEVLANAGVDVFEEAFKLIFTKLYDEFLSGGDKNKMMNWLEDNQEVKIDELRNWLGKFEEERKEKEKTGVHAVDPDDEIGKLCKKFYNNRYSKFRNMEFRNTGVEMDTKKQIDELFEDAKKKWEGIFSEDARIELPPSHLQTCVSYLEEVKLFNSNLEVVDEAFEYLVNKDSKGDKGQYFTPRYIIDMCVKMLNPTANENMIDTAAGSCGFPVHTIFYVWEKLNPNGNNSFSTDEKTNEQKRYVRENVFAMDFDLKAVRVGRTLNLIAGDGETNVIELNSLDYERWEVDYPAKPYWKKYFQPGFDNLVELRTDKKSNKQFQFDLIMANPPFAGDIKDQRLLRRYELAKKMSEEEDKETGKKLTKEKGWHEKISRDVLFIERNLDMLKDGGRMAIVLPQGRFNNQSDRYIRNFIAERCRILAVVGLHGNSFKPHTGTKTSVLFVQKWHPELCPQTDNYNIFFATQKQEGKNNSGEKLYWKADKSGTTTDTEFALKDKNNHPIVYHDLFNTEGLTQDGIAEAFIQFAAKERLSFF